MAVAPAHGLLRYRCCGVIVAVGLCPHGMWVYAHMMLWVYAHMVAFALWVYAHIRLQIPFVAMWVYAHTVITVAMHRGS